ncbi:DEAD/DEAH box helicase [Methanobacterium sp. CWC-01]|uniref:DEAD/DEAH box helicase n=1 Tax=Methanobacterium aridiramus TaxID=2584467 RepID=UPI00257558F2|nr:DEAD/DEAH box helicase [Methanobacterium sp. CWC-01]WJI10541.1 DEAD/DEAH box helicase [Methanobacterium sp. CWC-01]
MIILRKKNRIVELFPIGSSKGALNQRRQPLFYAYLKLRRVKGQLKIHRFVVQKDKEMILPPSEAVKILRKQNVFLVGDDPEVEELMESLHLKYRKTSICRHCTFTGHITLLEREKSYRYHKDNICLICAEEEIKRELKNHSFDLKMFPTFRRILYRTGDLEKVLKMFDPRFNPLEERKLTLYDRIAGSGDGKNLKVSMDQLDIPDNFKAILKKQGTHLLPVQVLAVNAGLLAGENLLVVSATASGKTLIGELAGIPRAMKGGKFLYLSPLVALANQKYRDFRKRYGNLGLRVSIRVGMSRIKAREELSLPEGKVEDSDIIVGTYEGLDFLLRAGRASELGNLSTVVVDEIHMLGDEDRGPRLKGLIQRLRFLFPNLQIIGLSATVGNNREIAYKFGMKLVEYSKRPVPLERHLIFARTEEDKNHWMTQLTRSEFQNRSKKGFHGQSIIFTNSRRKTHLIADYLVKRGIKAAAYHAGLSYSKKNRIEKEFGDQKISTVVTTAALAAGVDFPASQVIFESLNMGREMLTPNEFSQMMGRAGRPSYHDQGKVYLIPEVGRKYGEDNEEKMAITLLDSGVESIHVQYSEAGLVEQVLADVCARGPSKISEISKGYEKDEIPLAMATVWDILLDQRLIKDKKGQVSPTAYGRAVSMSFLNYHDALYIQGKFKKTRPLEIALKLEPFESAYLSSRITNKLGRVLKINMSSRLFADSTLDIISSGDTLVKLEPNFRERILNMQMEFFSCKCKERPFCGCFQRELSRRIVRQRLNKEDPADISRKLLRNFEIHAYAGDIFSWLDSLIRMLEAIERISMAFGKNNVVKECRRLIRRIEN